MARRFRKPRITQMVPPVHHSDTLIGNAGGGSVPATMVVLDTEAGPRSTTGGISTIQVGQGTNEEVNVGTTVKFINLFIQAGPRSSGSVNDRNGWLEWAFVCVKETETAVPITQLGVQTLGNVCKQMFRNECIFTGCMPVGNAQSNYQEIKIKVPRFKNVITRGDQWRFITYYRDVSTTSTDTDTIRIIKSFMYKSYN